MEGQILTVGLSGIRHEGPPPRLGMMATAPMAQGAGCWAIPMIRQTHNLFPLNLLIERPAGLR
jgi:hypothetical protein